MPGRPVYIPSRKRSRVGATRLHGAFEGGFSAGYYNTAGSEEGWEPSKSQSFSRQQKLEDYMDDQDFNEWGGPKSVRPEFSQKASPSSNLSIPLAHTALLESMIIIKPPVNIGRQLLKILGWRDGSNAAYVPADNEMSISATSTSNPQRTMNETLSRILLSNKKLRKIQLQQKRVRIPPLKSDSCGLGFVPHHDAPEFGAARERRQRQARERALAATQGSGRDVYRVSDLFLDPDDTRTNVGGAESRHQQSDEAAYNSFETTEDFVGSKSVGGFALREDDDDVYDNNKLASGRGALTVDHEQFETVVYEHESDQDDDEGKTQLKAMSTARGLGQDLSGLLSSWASGSKQKVVGNDGDERLEQTGTSMVMGQTADGRHHPKGFVLGTASYPSANIQRHPGPAVPANFEPHRHIFAPEQLPSTLQVLSRAVQLELLDERKRMSLEDALAANATATAPARRLDTDKPMAGGTFSALAEAMKNRFRSSKTDSSTEDNRKLDGSQNSSQKNMEEKERKEIKITRSTITFVPSSLLCKRFQVPTPKGLVAGIVSSGRVSESHYFQNEIFNAAQVAALDANNHNPKPTSKKEFAASDALKVPDGVNEFEVEAKERPSMDVYKSIYEPESESSSESSDDEDLLKLDSTTIAVEDKFLSADKGIGVASVDSVAPTQSQTVDVEKETRLVPYDPEQKDHNKPGLGTDIEIRQNRARSDSGDHSASTDLSSRNRELRRSRHRKERKRDRRRHEKSTKRRKKEIKPDRKRRHKSI